MARYRHRPIWKTDMELAVRRFPRYHKYTLGSELRQMAQMICRLVARVTWRPASDPQHPMLAPSSRPGDHHES